MLSSRLVNVLGATRRGVVCARNMGLSAPALQKAADPIQQLFVDKLREYKSKSSGGKLVEPTPDIERELAAELDKLSKVYGGAASAEMTQFPNIKFAEAKIDPLTMEAQ